MPAEHEVVAALSGHELGNLGGPELVDTIAHMADVDPQLHRILVGSAEVLAGATIGYREFALSAMASLIAIGDTSDRLRVSCEAALRNGATDDEILDVADQAAVYVGAPGAVNAARTVRASLVEERNRRLPSVTESVVRLDDHATLVWDNGGPGVPMLLIHALSLDRRLWRDVYPRLASAGRVVAYDIRGHGSARGAPITESLDQLADDVAALLDRLGSEHADVYGASYGGAIAQHVALNHPGRVRSLGLIATASRTPTELLLGRAVAAEQAGMAAQVPETLIRWFSPETIAGNGWMVRYARACLLRARVEEWAAAWRAMANLDVVDRLGNIRCPSVAIAGAQDVSATPAHMRQTADGIRGCRYVELDPGTHMMTMEQPDPLAAALLTFRHEVDTAA